MVRPSRSKAEDDLLDRFSSPPDDRDPTALLEWAVGTFHPRMALTSSFGMEDVVLCHLATRVLPDFPIYFIDTGLLMPETAALVARLQREWSLNLTVFTPKLTVSEQDRARGDRLFQRDPDACCGIRKVEPMQRALATLDAWVTGMRREQSPTRARLEPVEQHRLADGRRIVKLSPLAYWSENEVRSYLRHRDLPYNPLHDSGYPSIGCYPCTRAVGSDEHPRAGRWSRRQKQECGLHELTQSVGAPEEEN